MARQSCARMQWALAIPAELEDCWTSKLMIQRRIRGNPNLALSLWKQY